VIANPMAWATAMRLAKGNLGLLRVCADGSVVVLNRVPPVAPHERRRFSARNLDLETQWDDLLDRALERAS
jgi:hypothetical protein